MNYIGYLLKNYKRFSNRIYLQIFSFLRQSGFYLFVISLIFFTQINWAKTSHKGFFDIELRLFLGFILGVTLTYGMIQVVKKVVLKNRQEVLDQISVALSPGTLFIFSSKYIVFLYLTPLLCLLAFFILYLKDRFFAFFSKFLGVVSYTLFFAGGIGILYSAFCAFTAGKFTLIDYGKYTNMIWNCGHGNLFRVLMDNSYLCTHLSFTLILLGPLFYIWDHPFLLSFVQWFFAMSGFAILWRIAVKNRVNWIITGSFLLVATINPLTQQVLLSEFHGTGVYFILFPMLYYFLLYNKELVIIPLLLLYGVREDSAFIALPIVLYFAVKDRWKWGYFWSALSLFYGFFACSFLFKWINGIPLYKRRPGIKAKYLINNLKNIHYFPRLKRFFWIYFPTMPFLKKAWLPLLVFPSVGIIQTLFSPYQTQAELRHHYPTPIIVCLMIGLLHAIIHYNYAGKFKSAFRITLFSLFLITVGIVSYHLKGFLPGGNFTKYYTKINTKGLATLKAVKHIPKKGILLCTSRLAGFCANRADLIDWQQYYEKKHVPDIIFFQIKEVRGRRGDVIRSLLKKGKFGVKYFDGLNVVMIRGYSTDLNKEIFNFKKYRHSTCIK